MLLLPLVEIKLPDRGCRLNLGLLIIICLIPFRLRPNLDLILPSIETFTTNRSSDTSCQSLISHLHRLSTMKMSFTYRDFYLPMSSCSAMLFSPGLLGQLCEPVRIFTVVFETFR